MWILFGILSVVLAALSILFAVKRNKQYIWGTVSSLSFTVLTVLGEYSLINNWVQKEDWGALMDVVPDMYGILTKYVLFLILLNMVAMFIYKRKKE